MKIQVAIKTCVGDVTSKCEMEILGMDLVRDVKEKLASSQLIAFPKRDLMLKGEILADDATMESCGVTSNACLEMVVSATEDAVLDQLKELLASRDLTCDELGLLYCYKFGVSVNRALATVGCQLPLAEFLESAPEVSIQNGRACLVTSETLKSFDATEELAKILQANDGPMDITALCAAFLQKFQCSVSSLTNCRPSEFLERDDHFVLLGRGKVCLKGQEPKKLPDAFPTAACRTPKSEAPWVRKEAPWVKKQERCDQMYLDLHQRVSSRGFHSRIASALNSLVDQVTERCFLNLDEVVKGGSVGNGTTIESCTDASVVFFVKGLPLDKHSVWLPSLLRSVNMCLEGELPNTSVVVLEDSLRLQSPSGVVDLRFSPAFGSYHEKVAALGQRGPEARKFFSSSFAKETTAFVQKQPGSVKVTIRLLKWWRDEQDWSCKLTRPSNAVLELVAIYASSRKPQDQQEAVANCMALFCRFNDLRIIWTSHYTKQDIWSPLLKQTPLLMDPVNPFVNVVDPQSFDPRELIQKATTTRFFF